MSTGGWTCNQGILLWVRVFVLAELIRNYSIISTAFALQPYYLAGDGEKKSDVTRKKSIKGEGRLDAAAHEVFVSSEDGCEEKLEVESSAARVSHSGKVVKWKKLTTKVLLKVNMNSIFFWCFWFVCL